MADGIGTVILLDLPLALVSFQITGSKSSTLPSNNWTEHNRRTTMYRPSNLAVLVFLGFVAITLAADRSPSPADPVEKLRTIHTFALGHVFEAGFISDGEIAFRNVMTNTNAEALCNSVMTNGTPEAKLYALCGLRKLHKDAFAPQAKPLVRANPNVYTMSGCLGMTESASNVVTQIRAGDFDAYIFEAKK